MQEVIDKVVAALNKFIDIIKDFFAQFNLKPNYENPSWVEENYPAE